MTATQLVLLINLSFNVLEWHAYACRTKDGRTLDGITTDESAASLTLKRAEA